MKKTVVEKLLPPIDARRGDGDIIPPEKDNRGEGDIIPRKQSKPTKPGKKTLLND